MPISELYQRAILEHNRHPRNHHELAGATHQARGLDALCGDNIRIFLKVDDQGIIRRAAFAGQACAVTTASASMLTEWLQGRSANEVAEGAHYFRKRLESVGGADHPELGELNLLKAVNRFPARVRNALLPWETTLRALDPDGEPETRKLKTEN